MLSRVHVVVTTCCCRRLISTTSIKWVDNSDRNGMGTGKGRKPWDKRFPVKPRDVAPNKEGGSREMFKILPERLVAPGGIVDKQTNKFIPVPEMVPEFIVPDLTDFPLKPYVTYTAKEINQSELTPKDVFNSVYAQDMRDALRSGKIKVKDRKVHLEDGNVLDIETGKKLS